MVTVGTAVVPALAFLSQLAAAFLWTESRCARHVSCTQLRHRRLPSSWSLVCATVNFWNSFLHIAKITCNMDMDTNMRVCVCVCVCVCVLCHTKLLQSCPTLCDRVDCSPPGSAVHGILQTRILEWVATPSSRGSFHPRYWILSPASSAL